MADTFRVVAIISSFNEEDIISSTIAHLVDQGVDVYLIDNRSTDDTVARARPWLNKGLISIEVFPQEAPPAGAPHIFSLGAILARKEKLANELSADWFINHDADEFREAPWPGMTLREAIRWVDRLGYNCIDFRVLNFPPLGDGLQPGVDPLSHFTHWEEPFVQDSLQRRCWKAQRIPASLVSSGGHEARFPDRRVFPIRFLMRHYPIRSQKHGERKIFAERKNRFDEGERAKGWHVQYDSISDERHSFLGDPAKLRRYDPDHIRLDLMLDNDFARAAEARARELASTVDTVRLELAGARASLHEAEKHAANVEEDRRKLIERLVDRERHTANLETTRAHVERHAAALEKDRDGLAARLGDRERHAANLENTLGHLQRHADALEMERDRLAARLGDRERHAANLETTVAQLERHAGGLERDREALWNHISERERHIGHLESARAEAERHAAAVDGERERLLWQSAELGRELDAIRTSRSWRWTAPLRRMFAALRR